MPAGAFSASLARKSSAPATGNSFTSRSGLRASSFQISPMATSVAATAPSSPRARRSSQGWE